MWWIRTIYGRLPVCGVLWFFSYLIFHCLILACASSLYCFQPDNRSLFCTGAHCLFVFPSFLRLVSFRPKENQIKSKQYNWRCWRRFKMCMRTHTHTDLFAEDQWTRALMDDTRSDLSVCSPVFVRIVWFSREINCNFMTILNMFNGEMNGKMTTSWTMNCSTVQIIVYHWLKTHESTSRLRSSTISSLRQHTHTQMIIKETI